MTQIQVAQELLQDWNKEKRALHSDGTSKKGRSFVTVDNVKEIGESLIAGFLKALKILGIMLKLYFGFLKKCNSMDSKTGLLKQLEQ